MTANPVLMDHSADLQQQLITLANKLFLHRQADPSSEDASTVYLMQALPLFAQLKGLQRQVTISEVSARSQSAQARNKMDKAQLDLHNLLYQQQHLEREIQKCEQYESAFQSLPLHSEEEFLQLAQEHGTEAPEDKHELTLLRLQFELSERQRLETRKKELLLEKSKLTKENATKKASLEQLEKQLEEFISSAKAIQSKMENL